LGHWIWVRLTGRLVNLEAESWLAGQIGETNQIGENYFERLAENSRLMLHINSDGAGLMKDFSVLKGNTFSPEEIHPQIRDFYEHTAQYKLDVWSQWSGAFKPFGWLIAKIFSRRLQQLNLPISPLETSKGITSDIIQMTNESGTIIGTGWLRKMIESSSVIYAGIYTICQPSKYPGKCVKVVFPLPNGNATVILKPQLSGDGSLNLISSGSGFGEPGFYFLVRKSENEAWVKYLSAMKEDIHVYVDKAGALRTDHVLKLWGATFLRLHYQMQKY
jgi:hypothetical protein